MKTIASASNDETIILWDVAEGKMLSKLRGLGHGGHDRPVRSCAFHTSGMLLASGSYDKTVKVWLSALNAISISMAEK